MWTHGWPLVTAAEMRALDAGTIEGLGVPGDLLMELAGRAVAARALALRGVGGTVHVVCGAGNNAGDGWVAARHLFLRGVPVAIVSAVSPDRLGGDAARNVERAQRLGVPLAASLSLAEGDVVVDALFGTGLGRPIEGEAAAWVARINESRALARVLAVDLPSGLDADTGQVHGCAVQADETLTIGLPKIGLLCEPGRALAGRVWVARIGIADRTEEVVPRAEVWTRAGAGAQLPPRPSAGHKGRFGHVLVAAGSEGMTGAAALAARAAGRAGAGLVTVACPASTNPVLEGLCAEAMTVPVAETDAHGFAPEAAGELRALAAERSAVVFGPGIGRDERTAALVRDLVPALDAPLVVDADGLHALREDPTVLKARQQATIVTPHPGEAAVLLGSSPAEVLADRPAAARALALATGAVVVLKGAGTVTAEPGGRMVINPTGGPALGTGGTGDVLAGLVGSLLAQGAAAFEAGAVGAYVHGAAGDRIAALHGDAGLLASELADHLPDVLGGLRAAASVPARWNDDVLAFPEPR